MAALVTPASVPSWIQPQSLWTQNLADNYTFAQSYMNSPSKISTVFHTFGRTDWLEGFMTDYLAIAYAWIARMYPNSGWPAVYQWIMGGVMPLVNGSSGWKRGWPDPYEYTFYFQNVPGASIYLSDTSQDANMVSTWADAFALCCSQAGNTKDPTLINCPNPPWDGTSIIQTNTPAYFYWRAAALHLAQGLSVSGASAASAWIDPQIAGLLTAGGQTGDPRWSFDTK